MSAPEALTAAVADGTGITSSNETKTVAVETDKKRAVKEKPVSYFSLFRYAERILTVWKMHFDLLQKSDPLAATTGWLAFLSTI